MTVSNLDRERRATEELEASLADPWTWRVIATHASDVRRRCPGSTRLDMLLCRLCAVATEIEAELAKVSGS